MEAQRLRRSAVVFALVLLSISAAVIAAGAAHIGIRLVVSMPPADSWLFYPAAALGALLIGPLFAWFFLIKPNRLTLRRGIAVGLLGSVVAHPLVWYLANLLAYLTGMRTGGFGILVMIPWWP